MYFIQWHYLHFVCAKKAYLDSTIHKFSCLAKHIPEEIFNYVECVCVYNCKGSKLYVSCKLGRYLSFSFEKLNRRAPRCLSWLSVHLDFGTGCCLRAMRLSLESGFTLDKEPALTPPASLSAPPPCKK